MNHDDALFGFASVDLTSKVMLFTIFSCVVDVTTLDIFTVLIIPLEFEISWTADYTIGTSPLKAHLRTFILSLGVII